MAKSLFALNNLIAEDLVEFHRYAGSVVYRATPGNVMFLEFDDSFDKLDSIAVYNGIIQINSTSEDVGYTPNFAKDVNVRALPYKEFMEAQYNLMLVRE